MKTDKEYYRIKKFNSAAGAILCSECFVILKEGFVGNMWAEEVHKRRGTYPDGLITEEEWDSEEPIFCNECIEKLKTINI